MPQMSPLMWSILFIMFSLLMIMVMIKIFFNYLSSPNIKLEMKNIKSSLSQLNWTW